MEMERPWDALPSLALVNIYCKITLKDRLRGVSLVCRAWNQATHDPRCWASMIAVSDSATTTSVDDAFVKDSYPFDAFIDPFDGQRASKPLLGVPRLRTLIERSGGGDNITSLYILPFVITMFPIPNDDTLLHLIADSCPNLKHLSLDGSYRASEEVVLKVIRSCRRLELIDFSDSPYFIVSVLEELGSCCPDLRGIRRLGGIGYSEAFAISTSLPGLRLLNLSSTSLEDEDLSVIVFGCLGLQYLDVTGCQQLAYDLFLIRRATAQIPEFLYDREVGYVEDSEERCYLR